jgi:WD40 repeat protein
MLPSQQPHQSPPNVIAVSSNGSVLISASPEPPTIYIQDRRCGGSVPTRFHPTDAHIPVSCAAFQSCDDPVQRLCLNFLLGFQNGKIVMYRFYLSTPPRHHKHRYSHGEQRSELQPIRVGEIKSLHKATMGGIAAAEFVPGHKSRIVSIGYDGRCRLVDCAGGGKILRT